MSGEQKQQPFPSDAGMGRWFFPLMLAVVIVLLPDVTMTALVASATDAGADQQPQEETAKTEDSVSDSSEAASESNTQNDKAETEQDAQQQDDNKDPDQKKNSDQAEQAQADEQSTDEKKKSEDKEMKSEESKGKAAGESTADGNTTVEVERPSEVDPPKAAPKPKDKPSGSGKKPKKEKCIIGATATLLEKQSELKFRARVDSGAKSCSLHVEEIRIEEESTKEDIAERMTENIGKVIHFKVKNGDKKSHILTSKIAGYVIIKNSNKTGGKRRYKVPLTFRWKHMEKEVLVTLTDRSHMEYPLLLGRNFLRGDFLVDVELDSDD